MAAAEQRRIHAVTHMRTLGSCWIIYGLVCLATALLMLIYSGTATVMFGALLSRVPAPFTLMGLFHVIYTLAIAVSAICGIAGLLAGVGLLAGSRSARALALVAGFLSLHRIPLGVTLGVYTVCILLPAPVPPVTSSTAALPDFALSDKAEF